MDALKSLFFLLLLRTCGSESVEQSSGSSYGDLIWTEMLSNQRTETCNEEVICFCSFKLEMESVKVSMSVPGRRINS